MYRRLGNLLHGIAIALLLAGTVAVASDATAPSSPTSAAKYGKGLLWKIERKGETPSYLFGTIHLADKRIANLPAPVNKAFDSAASLTTELIVDPQALTGIMQSIFFSDGRTLESVIGAALYRDVERAFIERRIAIANLQKYKPWAVFLILSMPPPTDIPPLDMQLQMRADMAGKKIEGLETAQEQIGVFTDMSTAEQRGLLEATLRELRASAGHIEAMIQAYIARDLGRLQTMADEHEPSDAALHEKFTQRLLTDRNRRMVERLRPLLKRGNTFIAVGAAHLPGRDGMLSLLEREGYRVQAIY
jgi:uncharacterized protein